MYGALGLMLAFVAGLGAYFYVQRRKRLRNSARDNYEFAVLDDQEEIDGMLENKRKRRAGELYDAFAGESDEELFSDEEGHGNQYRDRDSDDDDGGRR
jgi:kexin